MLFRNIKTVDENYAIQENMYVATKGTKITYIGKTLPQGYSGEVIDGKEKLLLPGFYNCHCHTSMTLMRGLGSGLPLDRWLNEAIFPVEALLTEDDIYYGALLGALELLASGVVSVSDMYFKLPKIAEAYEKTGIKANISNPVTAFDESVDYFNDRSYRETVELDRLFGNTDGRIRSDVAIHSEYITTEKVVRQAAEYAKKTGKIIQIHCSETLKEHEECKQRRNGRTPVEYLRDCGVLDSPTILAHCVYCEDKDIEIIKEKNAYACHNISSNMKLGSGVAPIGNWINKNVRIVIGTDGAASNNNLNFLEELQMAALVASGTRQDPTVINPATYLYKISRNGALAQGREDCGLIKVGMRADLIMFDLAKPNMTPDYDTLANVVYSAAASDICMTMVDGKIVYKNGVFPGIDIDKIRFEATKCQKRLLKEAGI